MAGSLCFSDSMETEEKAGSTPAARTPEAVSVLCLESDRTRKEKESCLPSASSSASGHHSSSWAGPKQGARASILISHLHFLPMHVSKKLDRKQSHQDSEWLSILECQYRNKLLTHCNATPAPIMLSNMYFTVYCKFLFPKVFFFFY